MASGVLQPVAAMATLFGCPRFALNGLPMPAPKPLTVATDNTAEPSGQGQFVSFPDSPFELFQPYPPAGDQPEAIDQLVEGVNDGEVFQTLLGVTGSGKTFTMANVIARWGDRPLCLRPTRRWRRSCTASFASFFRRTRWSIS